MKTRHLSPIRPRGFTLMELLLVLAIIGLLMGGVAVGYRSIMDNGRMTKAKANIGVIQGYIANYQVRFKQPPSQAAGLRALITKGITDDEDIFTDPWGNPIVYVAPGKRSGDKYDVFSKGKDGIEGNEDDIGNWEEKLP